MRWPQFSGIAAWTLLRSEAFAAEDVGAGMAPEELGVEATPEVRTLLAWLRSGGATWRSALRIREVVPGERGIVTLHTRQAWSRDLVVVPLSLTLSPEECEQDSTSFVAKIPADLRTRLARTHALLHLCFLEHYLLRRESSRFSPYFGTMPKSLAHLPLLTTLNLTDLLQGSQLLPDIEKHQRDLEALHEEIGWELLDFKERITLEDFMLTYCMVESHSHARHEGNSTSPLMVPLIDLINHRSQGANLRLGRTGEAGDLAVHVGRSGATAADGGELFFTYSDENEAASVFFKQFGFVDPHLQVACKIAFPLQPQHPNYEEKRVMFEDSLVQAKMMLERLGGEELLGDAAGSHYRDYPKFVIWRCDPEDGGFRARSPESARKELLPFARFVVFPRGMKALHEECDTSLKPPACLRPLPAAEDASAAQFLLKVALSYVRRYPGTVADDEARLRELAASRAPAEPYLRIRRDERRCLEGLVAEVQAIVDGTPGASSQVEGESGEHFVDRHEEQRQRRAEPEDWEEQAQEGQDVTQGASEDRAVLLGGTIVAVLVIWLCFRTCLRRWCKRAKHMD